MLGFQWAQPWALLLIPLVLALPLQAWVTGRNRLAVPSLEAMDGGISLRLLFAWLPSALQIVGLLCAVIALARPQIIHREVELESEGLDIVLALDTSGSMKQQDMSTRLNQVDRLSVAKGVIEEFVEQRPHDRIGLVVFGGEAFTAVPLTLDHRMLTHMLRRVNIGDAGDHSTAIGTATAVGTKRLKDLDVKEKVLIVLTDGQNTAGMDPIEASELAAAVDVTVYTIGIGARPRGLFSMMRDGVDEKTLTKMAKNTGGEYFRATDAASLKQVYATIDELEPSTAKVRESIDIDERYRLFLVPAFFLLGASLLLGQTIFRRGP